MPLARIEEVSPTRCVLERIVVSGKLGRDGTLIGLHGEYSTHGEILPLLKQVAGGRRIVAPRSARWSAYGDGGRFSWFSNIMPARIEPIGFGDALLQLEQLAFEFADDRSARGMVLFGTGQGGTMALALGALWPELFTEIVTIDAMWPTVAGWSLPTRDMSGIRALLVGPDEATRRTMSELGAQVTTCESRSAGNSAGLDSGDAIRNWMDPIGGVKFQGISS